MSPDYKATIQRKTHFLPGVLSLSSDLMQNLMWHSQILERMSGICVEIHLMLRLIS